MKKAIAAFLIIMTFAISFFNVYGADDLIAFPSAEGGGMFTTGARGSENTTIYHVTNLNDSGDGSLRDAVSKEGRIIVFDVAGTIQLTKNLNISKPNITILGQTSPGDGICVSGAPTVVLADNVIIRYMRFRMGVYDEANLKYDGDAFGATNNTSNLIVDHCSMSWSNDECCSIYAVKDTTVQWCIISEPLNTSIHVEEGILQQHGFGGIWNGVNTAFHHNLVASAKDRFPLVGTSATVKSYKDENDENALLDIRNNVFYNWGSMTSHGGQNGTRVNLISNYYKMGPASKDIKLFYKMLGTQSENNCKNPIIGAGTDLAIRWNYYDPITSSEEVTAMNYDNKKGVKFDSYTKTYKLTDYDENQDPNDILSHTQYIKDYPITTQSAFDTYDLVLDNAGANIARDEVDQRAVTNTRSRTSTVGKNGIIDLSDLKEMEIPTYSGTKEQDSDNDGIPDAWEVAHGLNPYNKNDALLKADDTVYDGMYNGYYNLEIYSFDLSGTSSVPMTKGIYYAMQPKIVDNTVEAQIVNNVDENGALFSICTYDETNTVLIDAKVIRIPMSESIARVSELISDPNRTKFFLWSNSLEPQS